MRHDDIPRVIAPNTIAAHGVHLYYRDWGSGRPVLLESFFPAADATAARLRDRFGMAS